MTLNEQTSPSKALVQNESSPLLPELVATSSRLEKGAVSLWRDFREFIYQGDALKMAIGIIIGAAFNR